MEGRTAAWGVVSDREPLNTGRRYRDSEAGQEDVLITVVTTPWEVKGNDLFKREDIPALRLIAGPMPFPPKTPLEDDLLTAVETPLSNENSSPPEAEYLMQCDRQVGDFPSYSRRRVVVFGIPEGSYRRFRGIDSLTDLRERYYPKPLNPRMTAMPRSGCQREASRSHTPVKSPGAL